MQDIRTSKWPPDEWQRVLVNMAIVQLVDAKL